MQCYVKNQNHWSPFLMFLDSKLQFHHSCFSSKQNLSLYDANTILLLSFHFYLQSFYYCYCYYVYWILYCTSLQKFTHTDNLHILYTALLLICCMVVSQFYLFYFLIVIVRKGFFTSAQKFILAQKQQFTYVLSLSV